MKIGFIGAGKAGFSLGRYFMESSTLRSSGTEVTGYYSRNMESAREASQFTGTTCFASIEEIVQASDTIFITVPDGEISPVWNEVRRFPIQSKRICHCSGALSSAVFSESDERGAFRYSVHPLFAIRSKLESYKELSQAFFTLEGHETHIEDMRQLFVCTGNETQIISAQDKVKYHVGAVFVSNHVTALMETGIQLLKECGFEESRAERVLQPLFEHNCRGIIRDGVTDALTGPVERSDVQTVQKHLSSLDEEDRLLYALLSKKLTTIAGRKHTVRDFSEIKKILEKEMEI